MITINNVNKSFSSTKALIDINLNIKKGEIFGIIGHSGAGKSTLLRCLNGLECYESGSITVLDKKVETLNSDGLRSLRKNIGMIFQNFNLLSRKNVYENIALPMEVWGYSKAEIKKRVSELLQVVGLEDKINSRPKELSGGQKQRVAIARALALEPQLLLCDEATSALDPKTTKSILQLLRDINEKFGITIVIVTHQMEVIKEVCSKIALMEGGEVKGVGYAEELFLNPADELKDLIGEEEVLPQYGTNIKILFPKEISQKCMITSMARELDIDFSIVWGKLERFRNDVLGTLVINVDKEHTEKIIDYLNSKSISLEVINHDV